MTAIVITACVGKAIPEIYIFNLNESFLKNLPDNVVDDDGVRGEEEVGKTLGDLRELQSRAVENL